MGRGVVVLGRRSQGVLGERMKKEPVPIVISPPPRMLEMFLITGRWPEGEKFMPLLTDKEDDDGAEAPRR